MSSPSGRLAIETRRLTKSYGRARGITDLDLQVEAGEIFGFIGPNGAGKSTTIRTLLGLIYPTSGSGLILGLDIVRQSREIKKQTGYVPAEAGFYPKMTVAEFLRYSAGFYPGATEDRARDLATVLDLDQKRKIADLSRGNQRKLMIVQALIHRPRLLILDEPTVGLDPLIQAKFFDLLQEENRRGVTIFLSSHILSEVQKSCRRVAIIKKGRIAAVEDVESLRKKQLRRVRLEFVRAPKESLLTLKGMIAPQIEGNVLNFMYAGTVGALLAFLEGLPVADLTIEEPALEEIFRHYYADEPERPGSEAKGTG
jgi:ABC-2 type transport system ATP-binding protein